MRAWNRAKLLWGYLTCRAQLDALPVEYIVETTAKCNLYCPMCPRETHPQPKADMTDEVFRALLAESGNTAEHMMLIGLGEPFMDPKIFERIEYCHRHSVSTLLSTNGTFLDERYAAKVRAGLSSFAHGLSSVRNVRAQTLAALYSLGIWMTIAAAFWMVLQAFGPPLDELNLASSMLVMGFAIAGSAIQAPGVGGGSQVLAILALTEIYGVAPEIATSAGIVLWLLAFMSVVPLATVVALQQGISLGNLRTLARGEGKEQGT